MLNCYPGSDFRNFFTAGKVDMEFLKGALVAGLWGCLVSLVLAFLFVAMTISFSAQHGMAALSFGG